MNYDILALGETMLALAPRAGETLRRADALLVDHAGAESNTCVGLARLGHRVAWISCLGADAAGDRILDALTAESVDTRWVKRDAERPTGIMLKEPGAGVRYYRHASAASAMTPAILDAVPFARARAVLVTGITALIGPGPQAAAIALLDRAQALRIVDPNLRQGLWGSERSAELIRPLIDRCDLLLAGAAELTALFGNADPHRIAARGTREVVVRDVRTVGALAGGAWHELDIRRADVVDTIGAGDAFNAGYISARLRGRPIDEALVEGVRCGAAVTGSVSDTGGFPGK
jgi:sugar/nucleoside kinase (ribokinase family)